MGILFFGLVVGGASLLGASVGGYLYDRSRREVRNG